MPYAASMPRSVFLAPAETLFCSAPLSSNSILWPPSMLDQIALSLLVVSLLAVSSSSTDSFSLTASNDPLKTFWVSVRSSDVRVSFVVAATTTSPTFSPNPRRRVPSALAGEKNTLRSSPLIIHVALPSASLNTVFSAIPAGASNFIRVSLAPSFESISTPSESFKDTLV